jgi:Xaa-Pro aminopeptidase
VDLLWENRPLAPTAPLFIHNVIYSGETSQNKRLQIAEIIKKTGADFAFLSAPESVNWLLNIRARDVENTPLCLANAIIDTSGKVQLFVDEKRVNTDLRIHLGEDVCICNPELSAEYVRNLTSKKILIDAQNCSIFMANLFEKSGLILHDANDPCTLPKAIKNAVEIAGMHRCHIRDGVAVVKLLCWLATQEKISELEVVDKLLQFRKQNDLFVEPSFDTIAGSGANGAIVHYHATADSNRILQDGELFLLDSGGQYYDGTTDITRTVVIGVANSEQKIRFTQVLKGHIALASAQFPEGTTGSQLDILARQFLWQSGADYDHGTGHGVGCFAGVHEAPQRISKRAGDVIPLAVGMVLSNEPAYYKEGEFGIRIENLLTVVEKKIGENGKKFLGFENLTCAPIDKNLLEVSLLTEAEKEWLKNYHLWVESELTPHLTSDEQEWLRENCDF